MPERMTLEAVLFDAGGTLVRLDFEWMSELLKSMSIDAAAARLRRAEVEGRRCYDASRGRPAMPNQAPPPLGSSGDIRAYFGGMLDAAGVPSARRAEVLAAFERRHAELGLWTRAMEGAREAIDGASALGLKRAVVSNSDGRAEMYLRDCGVRDGLEFVVDSHLVGVEKPDPAIVRIALERLGVTADRALFVGDIRSVDEAVASAAGTSFVLVDPYGDYGEGGFTIRSMDLLPAFIRSHFHVPLDAASASGIEPLRP